MLESPKSYSFVLTNELGEKTYGNCLNFYEYPPKEFLNLIPQMKTTDIKFAAPKSICILSKYGFSNSFREILKQLYRLHVSKLDYPIERIVCNFMDEIPIPDKGKNLIEYEIGEKLIQFYRPINEYPPYTERENYEYLFSSLKIDTIFSIYIYLLL